jgi:anti-sigma B factor antagonist
MEIAERTIDDVAILDLKGRLILDDGFEPLREALNRLVGTGCRKILLNLDGLTYLDSAGIGLIACKYVTLHRHNGDLKLCNLRTRASEVLGVTKLLTVFESFTNEEEALRSFVTSSSAP